MTADALQKPLQVLSASLNKVVREAVACQVFESVLVGEGWDDGGGKRVRELCV